MASLNNLRFNGKNIIGKQGVQGIAGRTGIQGTSGISTGGFVVNTVSSPYTLTTSDIGELIIINAGVSTVGINTVTVPANTFRLGDVFLITNITAPQQRVLAGIGVTFYNASTGTATTATSFAIRQNGLATLFCLNSNEFSYAGVTTT